MDPIKALKANVDRSFAEKASRDATPFRPGTGKIASRVLWCVVVCCSVWQCVARSLACVLQCVAVCCGVLQCVAVCCSVWQCVARSLVCVLHCVMVCCSVL